MVGPKGGANSSRWRPAMSPAPEPLTENGRIVAERLTELAAFFSSEETVTQLATAATETFEGDLLMMQLIVRKHLKAVEFTRAVASECCAGRGNVALALTRTVLEGAVQLSWAAAAHAREKRSSGCTPSPNQATPRQTAPTRRASHAGWRMSATSHISRRMTMATPTAKRATPTQTRRMSTIANTWPGSALLRLG